MTTLTRTSQRAGNVIVVSGQTTGTRAAQPLFEQCLTKGWSEHGRDAAHPKRLGVMKIRAIVTIITLLTVSANAQQMSQAKEDCENLMNSVLPFAEKMLKQHGEFFPFGGAMRPNGEILSVGGKTDQERPPSAEIIKLLRDGFATSARKGEYKATAIVYDVRVILPDTGVKSDAVAVALDHRDNYSVVVMFPYAIQSGNVRFGTTFAQKGDDKVFSRK
jgi:hypothetical protein